MGSATAAAACLRACVEAAAEVFLLRVPPSCVHAVARRGSAGETGAAVHDSVGFWKRCVRA